MADTADETSDELATTTEPEAVTTESAPATEPETVAEPETTAEAEPETVTEPETVAAVEPAASGPEPAGSGPAVRPNARKVREGLVVSTSMDKTAVVAIIERVRHPRYAKTVQRTKRLYAHDDANDLRVGDRVRLAETRPQSKLKRWRVVEVLERAK
jgi:small subunit ribosomal protein S17